MARYIGVLNQTQVQVWDREDVLIWDSALGGKYTPKEGYLKINAFGFERGLAWWWKKLWNIQSPPKTRIFLWCVLENKVPTWDNLQERGFQGPGWCALCRDKGESVTHLFLKCPFCKQVWKECVKTLGLGLECRWEGASILLA